MKVAYVRVHDSVTCRLKFAGVTRYAHPRMWKIVEVDAKACDRNRFRIGNEPDLDGCIVDGCSDSGGDLPVELGMPTIYLDIGDSRRDCKVNEIVHDNAQTVRLALAELQTTGIDSVCYADWTVPLRAWAVRRRLCFESTVRKQNVPWKVLKSPCGISHAQRLQAFYAKELAKLERPFAVLAANDEIAEHVMAACRSAGLSVPDDVRIVGIDNDVSICERTEPKLTSVQVDFERAGYRAAEMLEALVTGKAASGQASLFGPLAVIRRESTRQGSHLQPRLMEAVACIRREACRGLRARDVVPLIGGSRRNAEMRFRAAMGHSILDEINDVRFESVLSHLRFSDASFSAIADFCGFGSEDSLRVQFRRRFGMSMSVWHREHK